jgi:hypothetical protein
MTKIREFMTGWEGDTQIQMTGWTERTKEGLRGTAKGKHKPPNLRPFDLIRAPHQPVALLANEDMRVSVDSAAGPAPFFHRNINFDETIFQFAGTSRVETEMGVETLAPGEMLLIPRGIAHRSIGDKDSLRQIVHVREAITSVMGEDLCTSRTQFEVKRIGGPDYSAAAAVPAPSGTVVEKMFIWNDDPADATEIERQASELVGSSSTERDKKVSAVRKLRPFDLFEDAQVHVVDEGDDGSVQHRRRAVRVSPCARERRVRAAIHGRQHQHVGVRRVVPDVARPMVPHSPRHRALGQGL